MKTENLYWKGISNKERNFAIYEIEKVINTYGYIADFHMYSDIEISFKIEIEEHKIYSLYTDLKNCISLNDFENLNLNTTSENSILLIITFVKGTGDLKIEVPSVPG